jgi:hypothetical protein
MDQAIWTLATLTPEQERLIKEAEATLGAGVLLAFRQGQGTPTQLTPSQIACLQGLEQKLGLVILALQAG